MLAESTTQTSIVEQQLDMEDIARILRITVAAVKARLTRAKHDPSLAGKLLPPSYLAGGRRLWHPPVVRAWLEQQTLEHTAEPRLMSRGPRRKPRRQRRSRRQRELAAAARAQAQIATDTPSHL